MVAKLFINASFEIGINLSIDVLNINGLLMFCFNYISIRTNWIAFVYVEYSDVMSVFKKCTCISNIA